MRALTVMPGCANSTRLDDVPEPPESDGAVLVETLAIGICATDHEIVSGGYGDAPPGHDRLILGHESLGRVVSAPKNSGLTGGDLVVGIVRRPDPVPCPACSCGEWDMCRNGLYTERGIKLRDGYASEHFRVEPEFAVRLDPKLGKRGVLLEPTSIVAKAWDHIDRIASRSTCWDPKTVLVMGAGPIGLLAALLGAQRGFDIHVCNRSYSESKVALVRGLGGTYHTGHLGELKADIVLECTGAGPVVIESVPRLAPDGVLCLTGFSSGEYKVALDVAEMNRRMVLDNNVMFGSVNANRRHYESAADALAKANADWLELLITRRVPLERWPEALQRRADDIKVVLNFAAR